jgi:hypothetical protein
MTRLHRGGTSVVCVGAMRCLRGDLVEQVAHHDALAQKCIFVPPCTSAAQTSKIQASLEETKRRMVRTALGWFIAGGSDAIV